MKNKKYVLISESGYSKKYDALLTSILENEYELFCVLGKDCELWEDIMDEIAVGDGSNPILITTSSHPKDSKEDVLEFANSFKTTLESGIDIVCI